MRNAGIPSREVMIPTGSSDGGITERANKSHNDKNAAANINEKINNRVCLGPVIILTAFGIIKPTNPIIPENAEVTATVNALANKIVYLHFVTLIPLDFAKSSSMEIRSKSFAQDKSKTEPITIPGNKNKTSFQHALDKLPIVHKTT